MYEDSFDVFTRRASLATLGVAGMATFAGPLLADAKDKTTMKARKKCKKQVGQCTTFQTANCEGNPDCIAKAAECCPSLERCDVIGFFTCFI